MKAARRSGYDEKEGGRERGGERANTRIRTLVFRLVWVRVAAGAAAAASASRRSQFMVLYTLLRRSRALPPFSTCRSHCQRPFFLIARSTGPLMGSSFHPTTRAGLQCCYGRN